MKDDAKLAKYVVHMYIRNKPELEEYREDLEQEAWVGILECNGRYDKSKGSEDLFRFYRGMNNVQKYVERNIQKHFNKPEVDHESPYWDIVNAQLDPDELLSPETDKYKVQLMECLSGVTLSPKEQEFLELYLQENDVVSVATIMGISKQRAHELKTQVISKAKQALTNG